MAAAMAESAAATTSASASPRPPWRAIRARARAAARAAGHRPGTRAHALVAFPERSDARSPSPAPPPVGSNAPSRPGVDAPLEQVAPTRFSNHERAWLAHSTAPPACGVFVFFCFFSKTTIDRSIERSIDRRTRIGPRRSPTRPPPFPSTTPRDTKRPALWAMFPTPPRRLSP